MSETTPNVLLALVGDVQNEAAAQVKYGLFARSLSRLCGAVLPFDASLHGPWRWVNALSVFHPIPQMWRERFWKNISAFDMRSRRVARKISKVNPKLVLQIGVLFDATRYQSSTPVFIYTDYTAHLSARHPETGRSPFSAHHRQAWLAMETQAYRRAAHIFVRSHFVRDSLIFDYEIPTAKISVVGGGVNFESLPKPVARPPGNESPLALFVGKEFQRKGGDILLDAFARARLLVPNARLRLVTGEPIPDYLPTAGVEILPPTWDREQMGELYQDADFFVLPSRLETWGDVLLEAMSYGLPCIGVQSDAMKEIISEGETGFVVALEDVQSLADALTRMYLDEGLRLRLGQQGRKRVENLFTWDKVVARMKDTIRQSLPENTTSS